MKSLNEYIKESLLGDWEDVNPQSHLNDHIVGSAEFINAFKNKIGNKNQNFFYDNDTDTLTTDGIKIEIGSSWNKIDYKKSIMEFLPNLKTIKVDKLICHAEVNSNTLPKNIEANAVALVQQREIKDVNIKWITNIPHPQFSINSYFLKKIDNIFIKHVGNDAELSIRVNDYPDISNFKVDGVSRFYIRGTNLLREENMVKKFDKLLNQSYSVKYFDMKSGQEKEVKIKTLKKIVAMANNRKRYMLLSKACEFKQGVDLIKEFGLENVNNDIIEISDNLNKIVIYKSHQALKNKYIDDDSNYVIKLKNYWVEII